MRMDQNLLYHGGMNIHLPSFAVVRSPIVCLFSCKPTQWISCFYMFVGFNQSVFFVCSLFSILMSCHFLVFSCFAYAVQSYQNLLLSPQSTTPCSLVPSISGGQTESSTCPILVDHNSTEAMACAMVLYPGNLIRSALANSWKMLKTYEKNGVGNIGNRMEYVYCIMIYIYI